MKQALYLCLACLLLCCSKDQNIGPAEDGLVTLRVQPHVRVRVTNPDTKNAVGEEVRFYLGVPDCKCDNPGPDGNCIEAANVLIGTWTTGNNGKVKIVGASNGFVANVQYTACVQYFPGTPCNLNNLEHCDNDDQCTFSANCVQFTTNSSAGTDDQIHIQKT